MENKISGLGLRDILMYLVPGTVILVSIVLLTPVPRVGSEAAGLVSSINARQFAASVIGVLLAYFLGHAAYPLAYPLRRLLTRLCSSLAEKEASCGPCEAKRCLKILRDDPLTYGVEISRCLSLARFASAMVFPSILLGAAMGFAPNDSVARVLFGSSLGVRGLIPLLLGIAVACGFGHRFIRYQSRLHRYLECYDTRQSGGVLQVWACRSARVGLVVLRGHRGWTVPMRR